MNQGATRKRVAEAKNQDTTCGGELVVLGTRLLSGSALGCCLLPQRR